MEIDPQLIEDLKPLFTKEDEVALEAYLKFSGEYHREISAQVREYLLKDAFFRPILSGQTAEEYVEQSQYSHDLQRDAIDKGRWEPYIMHLIQQGIAYANAGLQMSNWFSLVKVYKDCAQSKVIVAFADDIKQAATVWSGINNIVDFALSVIAQSYFLEKTTLLITEQQSKEIAINKLKESEEQLRAIYENSKERIYMVDQYGKILFINHVPNGQEKNNIIGSNFLDYQIETDRPKVMDALQRALVSGNPTSYEAEDIDSKGKAIYAGSIAPMFRDGKVYGAAIIARDATKRKKAEKEIRRVNERLEEKVNERTFALQGEIEERKRIEEKVSELNAQLEKKLKQLHATNQELESFSYTVSHDLRAPLRAIDGFSKVLVKKLEGKIDASQTHYLEVIIENVGKMGMLIDDLLAFSRMGRLEKKETTFDIEQLVWDVFRELMQGEEEHVVELKVNPLPILKADREMMKQVISNLLGNAIKFSSEKEEIRIEVGAKESKGVTTYYIKDNGVGFEMEYADKLFGIFQRLHSDDEFEGTGVGLAIVQRIIHRHNGTVWAESEIEKGATFYFSIPKN